MAPWHPSSQLSPGRLCATRENQSQNPLIFNIFITEKYTLFSYTKRLFCTIYFQTMNNATYAFCQCLITRVVITFLSAVSNLIISDHRPDAFQLGIGKVGFQPGKLVLHSQRYRVHCFSLELNSGKMVFR